jgi:hypothetical protein
MNLPPETRITVSRSISGPHEKIVVAELAALPVRVPARYIETTLLETGLASGLFAERGGLLIGFDFAHPAEFKPGDIGQAMADLGTRVASRDPAWPGASAEVRLIAAIDGHFTYVVTPADGFTVAAPSPTGASAPEGALEELIRLQRAVGITGAEAAYARLRDRGATDTPSRVDEQSGGSAQPRKESGG